RSASGENPKEESSMATIGNAADSTSVEASPTPSALPAQAESRLLSFDDVRARVSLSRTTLYALIRSNAFPEPVKIGRSSRWLASEIERWVGGLAVSRRDQRVSRRQ